MGQNKFGGSESDSPGNDPVSMSFNQFGWLIGSEVKFEFSEVLNSPAVGCSGVHSSEDGIEVDRFYGKDIVPFHIGKFGYSFSAENSEFCEFEIKGIILDHFPHEFLTGSEEYILSGFRCEPGKKCLIRDSLF